MTRPFTILSFAAAAVVAASVATAQAPIVDEHVFVFGTLTIEHPWARAAGRGADTLAFTEIINAGPPDRLLSVATGAATSTGIVGLANLNGVIRMIPVGAVDIPPGEFALDPGGLGLALYGLSAALVEGTEFELTLTFANAGPVTVHVLVEAPGAVAHGHAH